jgi:hypothetical protein
MDIGLRTPLLDLFRRGEVPRDIRLLAAQGALAPRAYEQLALLMLLVGDEDAEIARVADATIDSISRESLAAFLAYPTVSNEVRGFFAARGIEPAAEPPPDVAVPDAAAPLVDNSPDPEPVVQAEGADQEDVKNQTSALQKIAALNVAQRLALAMKGTREERAILIRDPNKIVGAAVLSSPKMSENEIESIARMANVSEDVLRIIAQNRAWTKNYSVIWSLTKNPKTPVAISMNMLSRLNDKDLRTISTDKNVPDVLRITARKKLVLDK